MDLLPDRLLDPDQEERDVVESYWLGVNSYITNPVSIDQFDGGGPFARDVLAASQQASIQPRGLSSSDPG